MAIPLSKGVLVVYGDKIIIGNNDSGAGFVVDIYDVINLLRRTGRWSVRSLSSDSSESDNESDGVDEQSAEEALAHIESQRSATSISVPEVRDDLHFDVGSDGDGIDLEVNFCNFFKKDHVGACDMSDL